MGYDVEMLKDFLEQLKWALRVDHFEFTHGPDALNPELKEQTDQCFAKRGVPRVLSLFSLSSEGRRLSREELQEALRRFAAFMAEKRAEQLRHLEALEELFDEALAHARGRVFEIKVPVSKILDGSFFKPGT